MISTFYALTHMPVSDALTLTNTFPIWIALLSWPLLAERPTLGVWLAAVCAVAGVALTQQPQGGGFPLAAVSALAASLFTSIAMMGLNRLQGVPALAIVVHFSGVATLFCLASYFVFDHGNGIGNLADVGVSVRLLGVGITATIGQIFLTHAFRAGSATKVAVVGLSQVVMVMLAEVILDGRRFDLLSIVGTILVLGPTAWLMMRSRKESATSPDAPAVTLPDPPVAETDPPTVSTKI
jgi:drug/metabolite transporter (DMT)-like permease